MRTFAVLYPFRYGGRRYEAGSTFDTQGDVPRYHVDKLWRDGCIGVAGADAPAPVEAQPAVVEEPVEEPEEPAVVEETLFGEDLED